MKALQITLQVGNGHCIEFAARKEYRRLSAQIMESADDPTQEQQAQFELLLEFLKTADFAQLRSSDILLSGEVRARCAITLDENGAIQLSAQKISSIVDIE